MAYVWEIHNGQILFECTGHKVKFIDIKKFVLSLSKSFKFTVL
jgi:hypothetical protein